MFVDESTFIFLVDIIIKEDVLALGVDGDDVFHEVDEFELLFVNLVGFDD